MRRATARRTLAPEKRYNRVVRGFVLALVVGLLTFSASGVSSLIVEEPCSDYELAGQGGDDDACPPTCVTCGCCAQAVEAVGVAAAGSPDAPVADLVARLADLLNADPRDILHVPKSVLA